MIQGIEHVAIASPDIAALAAWYVQTLGFEIVYQSPNAIFVKAADGSLIEIIHSEGDPGARTLKTPGIRHLALTVTEFDAVYANLKAKNVDFVSEPQESKGNKVVFFTDPEGNFLHLLQRAKPLV
jgi:catechol 2,3-dioxygenase-like lactoylglutathione lyase family enzyme